MTRSLDRTLDRTPDLLIDVRSRIEYLLGHLEGAINLPVDTLPESLTKRAGVGPETRIRLYCASGARSAAAAAVLEAAGYRRVTDAGGMSAARAGL